VLLEGVGWVRGGEEGGREERVERSGRVLGRGVGGCWGEECLFTDLYY
jgi:hypothetical protein